MCVCVRVREQEISYVLVVPTKLFLRPDMVIGVATQTDAHKYIFESSCIQKDSDDDTIGRLWQPWRPVLEES